MKKALVLCGGGAKGSYQMGVWKALDMLGYKFDIVTGTSIGCLNGAMYVQGQYDRCNELWDRLNKSLVFKDDINYDESVALKVSLKQKENILDFIQSYIKYKGVDITPFISLMDEYLDVSKMKESKVEFGIVSATFPHFKPVEVKVSDLNEDEIKSYILASVSCFPIFPLSKVNDVMMIDGGYYDNLPINYALTLGAEEIVAVDLNFDITHKEFLKKPFVKYIHPSWHLGGFLRFDRTSIDNNRILGYNDTLKAFNKLDGFRYSFYKEEGYNEICRKFTLGISKQVGLMTKLKIKTNVKPEKEGNIFNILEQYTYTRLSDYDYYIRALEIAMELFKLDAYKVYNVYEVLYLLISNINGITCCDTLFKNYSRLKNILKKKDFVSRIDDMSLIRYLYEYHKWEEKVEDELLVVILASKPKVFLIYMVLKLSKEVLDEN